MHIGRGPITRDSLERRRADPRLVAGILGLEGSHALEGDLRNVDLLKDAGVDMTSDEPLELAVKEMNRVMDEMEQILARRK